MVEVLSESPARLFGLPAKGAIEPSRDADLVVWDPAARRTLSQGSMHHTSDYTPYEGLEVAGAVVRVLSRGRPPEAGAGRFLERHLA